MSVYWKRAICTRSVDLDNSDRIDGELHVNFWFRNFMYFEGAQLFFELK